VSDSTPETPPTAPQEGPAIGRDEWVARSGENLERRGLRALVARFEAQPAAVRYAALILPMVAWPLLTNSDYLTQVGVDTLLFVLLALGLNVAVGWAGLLDLGYVAFYAFGAYAFALLASQQFDKHLDAQWAIPLVVLLTMVVGLLLGLPSWRVSGDYLAIVTLFFLQIFLVLLNNIDRPDFQFLDPTPEWAITNGPNGISTIDPLEFFGKRLTSLDAYYWLLVGTIVLVLGALYFANHSRTGRAWRALREDILAAEVMSMPVKRLKLLAFVVGAGVAGLAGSIFAAQQGAVFPVNFDLTLLITLYAMVILGGAGSLAGVAIGAIVINLSLELLRDPDDASLAFFGALVLVTLISIRPLHRWAVLAAGTIVFGLVVHWVVDRAWPEYVAGASAGTTRADGLAEGWAIIPADPQTWNRVMYLVLVAGVLALSLVRGWWRIALAAPVLYLAVSIWESAMLPQPAVARYLLIGAMLVGLMAARPEGILGAQRVEIV
jgi:ABC-type branched-subunit amino acid transport system permease subunit